MPVQFKGQSEYKTHYQWLESFKSKGFHPAPEQAMDPAGQPSVYSSTTMEPPLQHKKRLDGPPTSLSTDYFSVPSKTPEYTLLGQQEKFASNVRYQSKQAAPGQMYKNKENFDDAPPPSKQLKMQKRIKPLIKERHPPVSRSPPRQSATQPTPKSPPPAPRGHKDNFELKEALKDKDLKDILGEKPSSQPVPDKAVVQKSTKPQDGQKKEAMSNMNEFVQTDMKKGVAVSAPEAPAEYALKYKAGVAPPRPVQKVSEYQKQFQWKKGMKASPLLAAQEIVYKSNADLGPYKLDGVPRVTEYNRQFQPWKPIDFLADVNFNVNNNNNNNNVGREDAKPAGKKKNKARRSKSAGAVLRQDESADFENDAEAGDADESEELKAKLKNTHGKIRRIATEYRSNYKSPTRFSYEQGAWRGALPPQLIPQLTSDEDMLNKNNNNNNNNNAADNPTLSNWFAEVIELRRRAEEYRKRAQGTHFSREHLVQLMAKQNECWDITSETSPTIKALNLEAPAVKSRLSEEKLMAQTMPVDMCSHEATEGDSPVMSDVEAQEQEFQAGKKKKGKRGGRKGKNRQSRKMAWLEEQKEKVAEQRRKLEAERERQEAGDDAACEEDLSEGRLPTPLIQQNGTVVRRHHLDLTTPSVGGAILTCPPTKDSKMIVTSRSGDSYVTASDDYPTKSQQKTYSMDKLLTMPVLGKPSGDSHPLRDDSADDDRPMKTQYLAAPLLAGTEDDKENTAKITKQVKKRNKGPKLSDLTTVPEGYGKTYKKTMPYCTLADIKGDLGPKDDDVMSVSLMSVASSSSLASEVLERTKKRQEFWNKK